MDSREDEQERGIVAGLLSSTRELLDPDADEATRARLASRFADEVLARVHAAFYETAKRSQGALDFTDLTARHANNRLVRQAGLSLAAARDRKRHRRWEIADRSGTEVPGVGARASRARRFSFTA